jgi:hypothetical protein
MHGSGEVDVGLEVVAPVMWHRPLLIRRRTLDELGIDPLHLLEEPALRPIWLPWLLGGMLGRVMARSGCSKHAFPPDQPR